MKRIKRLFRPVVRRTLSPKTVQLLRFRYWYLSSYFPRLLGRWMVNRTPEVRGFGKTAATSSLANQLQRVNVFAPTKTCRVMARCGSDKGRNNYTPVYSSLFNDRRDQPLRVFELGLGTNNLDTESNMGIFGAPGASLRGWRQLFPHASVYGADIDRRVLFQEDRIKTFFCDQLDQSSIRELWSHEDLREGADIIIEDGLHTFEANLSFLEGSLKHVRPGGVYITEDINWESLGEWQQQLEIYSKKYPEYEFALVILARNGCNNMFIARRNDV